MKFGAIVATMESLGVEPVSDMEIEQNSTEMVEAVIEAAESGEKVEKIDAAISDATAAVDTITEAQEITESKEGDLTPTEQATMESLYAGVMDRLGFPVNRATLESNSNSRSDWVATLESEKAGLVTRIWEAIKAMLNTAIGFISSLLKNKTLLGKYIDSLIAKAKSADDFKGGAKVSAQFKDYNHVHRAAKNLDKVTDSIQGVANNAKRATDLIAEVKKITTEDMEKANDVDDKLEDFGRRLMEFINLPTTEFAGGDTLSVKARDKLNIDKTVSVNQGSFNGDSVSLSKSEAIEVLGYAKASLDELKALTGLEGLARTLLGMLKDGILSTYNGVRGKRNGDAKSKNLESLYMLKLIIRAVSREFGTVLGSFVFKNIKAMADYAKASLAAGAKA